MRYLIIIILIFLIVSCNHTERKFPIEEKQMIENKMYGVLLEYALFDSSKIDFVNTILSDTLRKNSNLIFSKIETIINDSSYFFFHMREHEWVKNDYLGVLYIDINQFDSLYMYSFDSSFRYSTKHFMKIIEEIANRNKKSLAETIKHRKIGEKYVPHFYFIVMTDTNLYEEDLIRKFQFLNRQIDSMLNSCVQEIFLNEKLQIEPYIEISSIFTEMYKSRLSFQTPSFVEEGFIIEDE